MGLYYLCKKLEQIFLLTKKETDLKIYFILKTTHILL